MKAVWDQIGERLYETGVAEGMLYLEENGLYPKGVPWNGLTSIEENPSGGEPTKIYANNGAYLTMLSLEEYKATVKAYMYPDEFSRCDGSMSIIPGVTVGQQTREPFGLAYKTLVGNDTEGNKHGYKIHILYNSQASPSSRTHETVNNDPNAEELSWELNSTPVSVSGLDEATSTSIIEIDSTKVGAAALKKIEDIIYGTDPTLTDSEPATWTSAYKNYYKRVNGRFVSLANEKSAPTWAAKTFYGGGTDPRLPLPDEIIELMKSEV